MWGCRSTACSSSGGSLLGVLFLGEPMTWNKIVGLAAAVFGVMLISI